MSYGIDVRLTRSICVLHVYVYNMCVVRKVYIYVNVMLCCCYRSVSACTMLIGSLGYIYVVLYRGVICIFVYVM